MFHLHKFLGNQCSVSQQILKSGYPIFLLFKFLFQRFLFFTLVISGTCHQYPDHLFIDLFSFTGKTQISNDFLHYLICFVGSESFIATMITVVVLLTTFTSRRTSSQLVATSGTFEATS